MVLTCMALRNFRNVEEQTLDFSPGVNILTGRNAQGKTNILEAMWLFFAYKSFRPASDRDLIRYGQSEARLDIGYIKNGRDGDASIELFRDKKRVLWQNGSRRTLDECFGTLTGVMFFPEHLSLIKQGPEERRRFIDLAICQLYPAALQKFNDYRRLLIQRNAVLHLKDEDVLKTIDIWDTQLAALGAEIYMLRRRYIERLYDYAPAVMADISDGREDMTLRYDSFCDAKKREDARVILYGKLRETREKDMRVGSTTVGPHRDNLEVLLNGRSARQFGSQGQQRSAVMALKLAETEILKEVTGEYPVLLFDDVFSELDACRKEYIAEKIREKQVIITSCESVNAFKDAKIFNVSGGKVWVR